MALSGWAPVVLAVTSLGARAQGKMGPQTLSQPDLIAYDKYEIG